MDIATLTARIQRLEDDRAIRDLKARYLRACDLKDPEGVRDTLAPVGAVIAYEGFPPFDSRDSFVAIYAAMGCQPTIFDIHHGANGIIAFDGPDRASGKWSLHFHNINLEHRTLTQMGIEYDDVYVRADGRWWIAETRTRRTSSLVEMVDSGGQMRVVSMGEPPAAFGAPPEG
ncbi:MAG: nuclear transport factor 2 family protein [Sandarakinorhabdus sp.]|nr:nuclear transport factor 2 family protein [Sandarakinorhabdus sp.]